MEIENLRERVQFSFLALVKDNEKEKEQLLDYYGLKDENENVEFEATTGGFIFDIYASVTDLPVAPYNREKEKKKRQKLVETLTNEGSINIPADVVEVVSKALKSDELWTKVRLGVKVADKEISEVFQPLGIELFPKVRNEVLKLCQ